MSETVIFLVVFWIFPHFFNVTLRAGLCVTLAGREVCGSW